VQKAVLAKEIEYEVKCCYYGNKSIWMNELIESVIGLQGVNFAFSYFLCMRNLTITPTFLYFVFYKFSFLKMANRNELHKRQMIWAEYRAGSSNGQAKININAKLDPDFISDETIDGFYQRFQLDHISLSDRSSAHYGIPQAIQKLPNGDEVRNF
jgi:hypothetical protein